MDTSAGDRQPSSHAPGADRGGELLSRMIDLAFFALVTAAAVRYLLSHGVGPRWIWVLVLSLALAASYLAARRWLTGLAGVGVFLPLAVWVSLVVLAPSFWWCAFSLLYLAGQALPRRASLPVLIALTGLTAWSLMRLAGGFDWLILVGVLVVALLLATAFVQLERNRLRLAETVERLVNTQAQLAASERRAGTLEERQRLAQELHDSVAQGLGVVLVMTEAAAHSWETSPTTAQKNLRVAADTARLTLAETRNMVHQLASPRLEGITLAAALEQLAAALPGGSFQTVGAERPLSEPVSHALLRIAQSASENVRRHARAETAHITLSFLSDAAQLDVTDNGAGFREEDLGAPSAQGGYGLRAMRQRAEALGGTLTIASSPGGGTRVCARIPVGVAPEGAA